MKQPYVEHLSIFLVLATLIGGALVAPSGPLAQTTERDAPGFLAAKGRVTFRAYCSSCHGADAKGNGNLAQYLKVAPADLTLIMRRRGGEFPRNEIAEIIDGRTETKGHGTREMPVWGEVFGSPLSEPAHAPAEEPDERAERKVRELVFFLESIQRQR